MEVRAPKKTLYSHAQHAHAHRVPVCLAAGERDDSVRRLLQPGVHIGQPPSLRVLRRPLRSRCRAPPPRVYGVLLVPRVHGEWHEELVAAADCGGGRFLSIGAVASTSLRVSPTAHTTQVPSHPTQDHAVHRAIVCLPPRPVCPVDPADLCSMQIFHICIGDIERQGSPPNLQVRMLSRLCPSLIYEHALHHSPLTATSSPLTYRFRAAPFVDPRVRSYRGAKAYLPDVQIESADERFKVHRLKTRLACIANMLSAGTHVPPGSAGAIVSLLRDTTHNRYCRVNKPKTRILRSNIKINKLKIFINAASMIHRTCVRCARRRRRMRRRCPMTRHSTRLI
jgi:hypothetical protein